MPKIEKIIAARKSSNDTKNSNTLIPKYIHQTFISNNLPQRAYEAAKSWSDLNPKFEYRFYDDDDQYSFIKERFGEEVLAAYKVIPPGAFRADLWRYCILHEYGGVYADLDTTCKVDLEEIIRPDDEFLVPNGTKYPFAVFNTFICSKPEHPILVCAIERMTKMVLAAKKIDGWMLVGPGGLGKAINVCIGEEEESGHTPGEYDRNGVKYRILEKKNAEQGLPRRIVDGEQIIMFDKYEGYMEDLAEAGVVHWRDEQYQRSKRTGLRLLAKKAVSLLKGG